MSSLVDKWLKRKDDEFVVKIKEYLEQLEKNLHPEIFNEKCQLAFQNIAREFGNLETEETIQEVNLSFPEKTCDYSFKIDYLGKNKIREKWYELDYEVCLQTPIRPCWFLDASSVIPGENNDWLYHSELCELLPKDELLHLKPMMNKCITNLKDRCDKLFQLGVMSGRNANCVRLFTEDMKKADLIEYLKILNWNGDLKNLSDLLTELEEYSDRKLFILDFDIYENSISDKIGINFGTKKKDSAVIQDFLEYLVKNNLCIPEKYKGVMNWIDEFPSHTPFIVNDISHFKIPYQDNKPLSAKAYLRQGTKTYTEFKAFKTPVLMNLELTNICPLHCPQCYCDLEGGQVMEKETALYWIKEGAKNHVRYFNLSGGETLCYPYLYDLIETCREYHCEANIAISGWGFNKAVLKKLETAGISDICVSLNGSTKEINEKSRDGYELAIHALEVLKENSFSSTCINWVMHVSNGDDFENMIRLSEQYHVKSLVVMVFKPDSRHELPSLPTKEQISKVVRIIKSYQGKVKIEVEECFSQMKVLLAQRFLGNMNRGVEKGCGAGRDMISVSLDGRLTPCRHLEYYENRETVKEYWNESSVLKELRLTELDKREPCKSCRYSANCRPCMAVNSKINHSIYMGDEFCMIGDM